MLNNDEFDELLKRWKDAPKVEYEVRPWGMFVKFTTVCGESTHKEIVVKPGHRLSLQKHAFRDEWWFIASPDMMVELGPSKDSMEVKYPEPITEGALVKIFIPRGWWHRLSNIGKNVGHVFEDSLGEFKESDIMRIEDDYDRVKKTCDAVSREIEAGKWLELD